MNLSVLAYVRQVESHGLRNTASMRLDPVSSSSTVRHHPGFGATAGDDRLNDTRPDAGTVFGTLKGDQPSIHRFRVTAIDQDTQGMRESGVDDRTLLLSTHPLHFKTARLKGAHVAGMDPPARTLDPSLVDGNLFAAPVDTARNLVDGRATGQERQRPGLSAIFVQHRKQRVSVPERMIFFAETASVDIFQIIPAISQVAVAPAIFVPAALGNNSISEAQSTTVFDSTTSLPGTVGGEGAIGHGRNSIGSILKASSFSVGPVLG